MLPETIEAIKKAIKAIKTAQVPVVLELFGNDIGNDGADLLAEVIRAARVPLTLDLGSNDIGPAGAGSLAEAIMVARVPLTLDLSRNNIGSSGAGLLAKAMMVAQVPLILDLSGNNIGSSGAGLLAEAMKIARVTLILDLGSNDIESSGAMLLAKAMMVVRVPLTLGMSYNSIGDAGAKAFAEAMIVARAPLTLDLGSNNIGFSGARFLAEAIKAIQVPLTLNLDRNDIGDIGAGLFAEAIKKAQLPLALNLWSNDIGDIGAEQLAQAMSVARAPLTLNLGHNGIEDAGATMLAEAMRVARVPLILHFDDNVGAELLDDAEEDNFIIDARLNPSKFLKYIGGLNLMRMLEHELYYPSVLAKIVLGYISDVDLAWTCVAAIRSIDGASHDNKYSSIDWRLVNEVYPGYFAGSNQVTLEISPKAESAHLALLRFASVAFSSNLLIRHFRGCFDFSTTQYFDEERLASGNEPYESKLDNHSAEGNLTRSDLAEVVNDEDHGGSPDEDVSSSSSAFGSPPPSGSVSNAAELADRIVTNCLLGSAQPSVYICQQDSKFDKDSEEGANAEEALLKRLLCIEDLPEPLQQKRLLSCNLQKVLKLLEGVERPGIHVLQLSVSSQDHGDQDEYENNATEYARASQQDSISISKNSGTVVLSNGVLMGDSSVPEVDLGPLQISV